MSFIRGTGHIRAAPREIFIILHENSTRPGEHAAHPAYPLRWLNAFHNLNQQQTPMKTKKKIKSSRARARDFDHIQIQCELMYEQYSEIMLKQHRQPVSPRVWRAHFSRMRQYPSALPHPSAAGH
jgi:hypothetical protein